MKPLERALLESAEAGDLKSLVYIVDTLIADSEVGDINCVNGQNKTALHCTIEGNSEKHYQCFLCLLKVETLRADIFDENGRTALHAIILLETEFDYFDQLTRYPNKLVLDQHQRETPPVLTLACQRKCVMQAKKLIDLGANLNAMILDASFPSLFMWLVETDNAETVALFLQHGMNALDIDLHQKDPYLVALSKKNIQTIKVLLRFGYGIARDLTEDFLKLGDLQDDFYWLVGSRVMNRSLTLQKKRFQLAFISQEDLIIARKKLTTIRESICVHQALTQEQHDILLSRIEVEWRQWSHGSRVQLEIEQLYYVLRSNQAIKAPEKYQSSEFDYLFDIPYKKLLKHFKSDVYYDHSSLLRFIIFNQKNSLVMQVSELITKHADLTTIKQVLLFLDNFRKAYRCGKEEKSLSAQSLIQKFTLYCESDATAHPDFTSWRDDLEKNKGIVVSNEEIVALIKDKNNLSNYFIASEIYSQTMECMPRADNILPLQNTLLTLNQWMEQITNIKESYEKNIIHVAKALFFSLAFFNFLDVVIFWYTVNNLGFKLGLCLGSVFLCTFFFLASFPSCMRNLACEILDVSTSNNAIDSKSNDIIRFFLPASFHEDKYEPLQGLQKGLLAIKNYLNPEPHQSLLNIIARLTRSSCCLPNVTISQTITLLGQLSEELHIIADAVQHQMGDMDTEYPQAIILPARFVSVCFYPEVKNLGELSPEYAKNAVVVEVAEEVETPTETMPLFHDAGMGMKERNYLSFQRGT